MIGQEWLSIRLDKELADKLRALSRGEKSRLVRMLIRKWVLEQSKKEVK